MSTEEVEVRTEELLTWLKQEFPRGSVSARDDSATETVLLQVWTVEGEGPPCGVNCSYEVLEDNDLNSIIEDWTREGLLKRFRDMRGFIFRYRSDRQVLNHEIREIWCDEKRYTIVRHSNAIVEAFTKDGDRLRSLGDPLSRILSGSIWSRSENDLCRDVQRWKGPDQ